MVVDGNRVFNYLFGFCFFIGNIEVVWWLVDLCLMKIVIGVFIVNCGDENYWNVMELLIRVGFMSVKGGIGNLICGGLLYVFYWGVVRMVFCVLEVKGIFVIIFVLEVNLLFSLCEVEVEVSDIGRMVYFSKRGWRVYVFVYMGNEFNFDIV